MRIVILLVVFSVLCGCSKNSEKEKYQTSRDNTINVKQLIKEIDLGDILTSNFSRVSIADDYFIVRDSKAFDNLINVFDKNSFEHIVSFGEIGPGPQEITTLGEVIWNKDEREFYAFDHGKYQILAYNYDSIQCNPDYKPYAKYKIKTESFPFYVSYISDTASFCRAIVPEGVSSFDTSTGLINIKTGDIKFLKYSHPEISRKRFLLAVSSLDNIYAECNSNYDMISLFDLKGNHKMNIYGPQWGRTHLDCFGKPTFTKDYLIALYNGEIYEQYLPTHKCLVFSKSGDYLATLELEYKTNTLCYDAENDRLIFSFDDVIQFGYLNLRDLNLE